MLVAYKETETVISEKFAELLQEFYLTGVADTDISMSQYLEEMTEKLECLIMKYA